MLIKRLVIAFSLMGSMALAGCATTPGSSVPTIDPAVISAVQKDAALVCGFIPTVETVVSIIASFVPGGSAAATIAGTVASAICNAVAPAKASMKRGDVAVPMVNGIPVKGYFTR